MDPQQTGYGSGIPAVDYSAHGHLIDSLFGYITVVDAAFFALVVAVLVWSVVAYRARRGHRAVYQHGTGRGDFWLAAALGGLVFIVIDFNIVRMASAALEESIWTWPRTPNALRVEVLAQQWAWNIRYSGPDGRFDTPDDVVTLNDLRLPVGRPILFNIKSKDVIHSFNLPNFRFKIDANPGSVNRGWFAARGTDATGRRLRLPARFDLACAQMCGWAHYAMAGYVTLYSRPDFEHWYAQAATNSRLRYTESERESHWGWEFEE